MSTDTQKLLKSFDLLADIEKREVATEIMRRTFRLDSKAHLDESHLAALYDEFAAEDRDLAEQGVEDYGRGLTLEDAR
jgi:hypothetical protein